MTQQIDSLCDKCNKIADWRGRDPETGDILGAACKKHKNQVRSALIRRLQQEREDQEVRAEEDRIEDGQARWAETGSSRR